MAGVVAKVAIPPPARPWFDHHRENLPVRHLPVWADLSSIASNAISIGAAISISLLMLNGRDSCSTSLIDMLIPPPWNCPAPWIALRLALGAFDAIELVIPEGLKSPDPVVNNLEAIGVQFVKPLLPRTAHADKPHLSQDPKVLGDLRLGNPSDAPSRSPASHRGREDRGCVAVVVRRPR